MEHSILVNERTNSVQACKDDYLARFAGIQIQEVFLFNHIRYLTKRFVSTGRVNKNLVNEELEQNSQTCQPLQIGVSWRTCHKVVTTRSQLSMNFNL
jgi:hypothetical protein